MTKPRLAALRITRKELDQLRDYSHSRPTPIGGQRDHGRRWKINLNTDKKGAVPFWVVGEYTVTVEGKGIKEQMWLHTRFYWPLIT